MLNFTLIIQKVMSKLHALIVSGIVLTSGGSMMLAQEQLLITEFMAINNRTLQDNFGRFSDWIEIYNVGSNSVNLDGWWLTQSRNNPLQWRFPATNIGPNQYMIIFASGSNIQIPGQPLHTSFRLSGSGEYLALIKPDGQTVACEFKPAFPTQYADVSYGLLPQQSTNTLVVAGQSGRYLVPSGDIGSGWTLENFNDDGWTTCQTGIGFDWNGYYQSFLRTDLLGAMSNVNASAYLRLPFVITNLSAIKNLRLHLYYDDGFVAYINGQEVARRNAPANPTWNSSSTLGETRPLQINFDDQTNTQFYASQYGTGPAPAVQPAGAGSSGQFLRLIYDGVNNACNGVTFDQTAPLQYDQIDAEFDIRIIDAESNPADGFAFMLIPSSAYGTTGPGINIGSVKWDIEEPNIAGVFAVGFDVYPRSTQNDVSVHWNGIEYQNVTMPNASVNLTQGVFHRVRVNLRHEGNGARVTVTITPNILGTPGAPYTAINNLYIPGLRPYECRVQFGGRTGGLNMSVDLDNINVQFTNTTFSVAETTVDVSSFIPALHDGTNVLAIHGLNRSPTNAGFLLMPELLARDVLYDTNRVGYFTAATPGTVNEFGAATLAPPPQFSLRGGVYTNDLSLEINAFSSSAEIHYTLDGSAPTADSLLYTGPLSITNATRVRARVFAPNFVPSQIVTENYTILSPDVAGFSSKLPLVILNTFGQGIAAEVRTPISAVFIDNPMPGSRTMLTNLPDFNGRASVELHGQSSLMFPKKSLNLETQTPDGDNENVSLLGLPAENDWVLYAPYTDKSFLNDILGYELFAEMGHYSVRWRFVEVFLNGTRTDGTTDPSGKVGTNDYAGIYVLVEKIKIDKNRVNITKIKPEDQQLPEISGGYMFKKDKDSPGDVHFQTSSGQDLIFHDPKGTELTESQRTWLVDYINQFEAALYGPNWRDPVYGYARYADVDSFVDQHWIVEFTKNIDGYRLSNYMQKDRNGKIKMEPIWDWNLSFGNANYLECEYTNGWYWPLINSTEHIWLRRLVAEPGDPDFRQRIIDRWGELRTSVFNSSRLSNRVDELGAYLNEAVTRDYARWPRMGTYIWPNPNSIVAITNFAGMLNFIKGWIGGRYNWIDAQYLKAPVLSRYSGTASGLLSMSAATGTIYYTLDGSDPRLPGGAVSPNAQIYSAPIALPPTAQVFARARSGTNWSAPARGIFADPVPPLAITEIMYHPAPGTNPLYDAQDYEYIKITNTSTNAIDLSYMRLAGGVDFWFPTGPLTPVGAATVQNFDAAGTTYTPSTLGAGPGALVLANPPLGNIMRLTSQNTGTNRNRIAFDQTAGGVYGRLVADFDFRAINATPAPGVGNPTIQNFDAAGSSYTVFPATGNMPTVMSGDAGSEGSFIRLTPNIGSLLNAVYFDRTAAGTTYGTIVATFDFRITPAAGRADGMAFVLLNTATHGTAGVSPAINGGISEEPNFPNALGVGLDIYNNGAPNDPNNNHVSVHWNGSLVAGGVASPTLNLASGQFHRAQIIVKFDSGRALVTVRITPDIRGAAGPTETLFNDFVINGVNPFESRVAFGARTGGETALQDLDNVDIQYYNLAPASAGLSLVMLPVANFGATGAGSTTNHYLDLPNRTNVFGLNLNFSSSPSVNDVTLHWNGQTLASVYIPSNSVELDSGVFHHLHLEVLAGREGSTVQCTITPDVYGTPGTPINVFSNYNIAGMFLQDARVELAGRSGGHNINTDVDNLNVQFEQQLPNMLAPGESILVVHNRAAFESRYGNTNRIAGEFVGSLNNAGERLILYGANGEPLLDLRYNDGWYPVTDGLGFSLVVRNPNVPGSAFSQATNYRPSYVVGGAPGGQEGQPPVFPTVLVNEVLANSQTPAGDFIELFNPSQTPADISYWFLSDDFQNPKKYQFPPGTIVPANGYLVVYESTFNSNPTNGFGLGADGDDAYLFSADSNGNLTGYYHGWSFGASDVNVSFGPVIASDGQTHYVALESPTPGAANSPPRVGPIVISEIMYHPPDYPDGSDNQEDEFIELANLTDSAVALYDLGRPVYSWRLRNAVDFDFPPYTTIAANGRLIIVSFDPVLEPFKLDAFRAKYGLGNDVQIVGPYSGKLDNSGEGVELARPALDEQAVGAPNYVLVDKVAYKDNLPWPVMADGMGRSLHRVSLSTFGNDPANWVAGLPTPGAGSPSQAPLTATAQPSSQTIFVHNSATFTFAVSGPGPIRYQWRFNEDNIPGATNATLLLTNVQLDQAGKYQAVAYNDSSSIDSQPAILTVYQAAKIIAQPANAKVLQGSNASFTVSATGNGPITVQWQFNGVDIPGATNATLYVTNVQPANEGAYVARITDSVGDVYSQPATLSLIYRPVFITQPQSQTVVVGSNVVLSAELTGTEPIGFRWRRNNGTYLNFGVASNILPFPNIQLTNHGAYQLVATNAAYLSPGATTVVAFLSVVLPPTNQSAQPGTDVTLTAMVGNPQNLQSFTNYVFWVYNGTTILKTEANRPNSVTTNILVLTNAQPEQSGTYTFVVSNFAVGAVEFPCYVAIGETQPPVLVSEPTNITVRAGEQAAFYVTATGQEPLSYQWWFNDSVLLEGATGPALIINPARPEDAGAYRVVVSNAAGAVTSRVATLTVLVPPLIVQQPTNQQSVTGSNATFTVVATGTAPLYYQWWFNLTNLLTGQTNDTLILTNLTGASAGLYHVVVTNAVGAVTSQVAQLAITPVDRDGDGLPDDWETANGLNPDDPSDKYEDADGDGLNNWQEFIAGTSPTNRADVLKLELTFSHGADLKLQFNAVSNRSYTLQYKSNLFVGDWQLLQQIQPAPSNRVLILTNPLSGQRFYRISTP